ncbi:hypothetical protein ABG79_02195 [Caloramator mitchellensis]|uniref:Uncharacterized protein n=1 Tax=Caloramator mitchellensis TaxID=908809 RepID=A0A0R3K1A4_CALMK|nr:hypothetical protein [Caloramator mitchellensis]KRQ86063.1 hypothetical protein ABG79_02195 [Caloramator mitchellensis]
MYNKTLWKDRIVEKPRTYQVQNNSDGTITLIPTEGTIVEAGTPITAYNLNKIEDGIYRARHLFVDSIDGTIQYPTYDGEGNITKIEHKDAQNNILRTDTFTYTPTLITETRTLNTGETLTLKYHFDANGNYLRTEVI